MPADCREGPPHPAERPAPASLPRPAPHQSLWLRPGLAAFRAGRWSRACVPSHPQRDGCSCGPVPLRPDPAPGCLPGAQPTPPPPLQGLLKKHEAFETDFTVHKDRVNDVCTNGQDLVKKVSLAPRRDPGFRRRDARMLAPQLSPSTHTQDGHQSVARGPWQCCACFLKGEAPGRVGQALPPEAGQGREGAARTPSALAAHRGSPLCLL